MKPKTPVNPMDAAVRGPICATVCVLIFTSAGAILACGILVKFVLDCADKGMLRRDSQGQGKHLAPPENITLIEKRDT